MLKWFQKWGAVLALVVSAFGVLGGARWLGGLEARLTVIEKRTEGLEPKRGARGDQCTALNDAIIRSIEGGKSEQTMSFLARSTKLKCAEFEYMMVPDGSAAVDPHPSNR